MNPYKTSVSHQHKTRSRASRREPRPYFPRMHAIPALQRYLARMRRGLEIRMRGFLGKNRTTPVIRFEDDPLRPPTRVA